MCFRGRGYVAEDKFGEGICCGQWSKGKEKVKRKFQVLWNCYSNRSIGFAVP